MNFFTKLFSKSDNKQTSIHSTDNSQKKWKDWVADNPNAKWETRFWKNNRFSLLMNGEKIEHINVFMYLIGEDAKVGSSARKKEHSDCKRQIKEMFGEIDVPIKFTTTDLTVQEYLKKQSLS